MKNDAIACLAFTERGRALAERISAAMGGEVSCTRDGIRLREWTQLWFTRARALVFVGAAGIAVRAVAPHLRSKAVDPAVICVDEAGSFVIPLLSGHLGGANELACEIAAALDATAAVTTATDVRNVFAVDEWARVQGCAVDDPKKIRAVSSKLLAGEEVTIRSAFPIEGEPPEGVEFVRSGEADVWVDVRPHGGLTLSPQVLVLGVGCKRTTPCEVIERRFSEFCRVRGILTGAVCAAATIDRKLDEPGLLEFCEKHRWTLTGYTAEELEAVKGTFTPSEFVTEITGVDNVCERSAVKASGGRLMVKKYAGEGVTLALARRETRLDWRWRGGEERKAP